MCNILQCKTKKVILIQQTMTNKIVSKSLGGKVDVLQMEWVQSSNPEDVLFVLYSIHTHFEYILQQIRTFLLNSGLFHALPCKVQT